MLNVRSESPEHRRLITYSKDGATRWTKAFFHKQLVEPICMASIVRYSEKPAADKDIIVFANPHNLGRADGKAAPGVPRDRRRLSIKLTCDEGKTWPVNKVLEPGYSAYSDLAVLPDGTILCLYERGRDADAAAKRPTSYAYLTLARFNLEWVMQGQDFAPPKSDYGAKRVDFKVAGCDAFIIYPTKPAADGSKPWVWYAPTTADHPGPANAWLLSRLLANGFYIGGVRVGETFANPQSRASFTEFYNYMVTDLGLSPKACLLAQSRGGLNHYNWAADHPDKVRCIAGIFPVGDLRSYPGLKRAAPAYGLSPEEFLARLPEYNPIERLAPIAKAKVPILLIHGDADKAVPLEQNSKVVCDRYRALGGPVELVIVPGKGHQNDPGFFESERMLRFLLSQGRGPF
jgi:hypothetical protein